MAWCNKASVPRNRLQLVGIVFSQEREMSVILRLATVSDVDLLLTLIRRYYEFDHIPFDNEQVKPPLERLLHDPALGRGWFIEENGKIIGYAILTFGFDLEFGGRQATLTDLYLLPEHRRQGIGRQTLEFIEEACRALGIEALELQVERGNNIARRLYEQFGMTAHDRIPMSKRLVR